MPRVAQFDQFSVGIGNVGRDFLCCLKSEFWIYDDALEVAYDFVDNILRCVSVGRAVEEVRVRVAADGMCFRPPFSHGCETAAIHVWLGDENDRRYLDPLDIEQFPSEADIVTGVGRFRFRDNAIWRCSGFDCSIGKHLGFRLRPFASGEISLRSTEKNERCPFLERELRAMICDTEVVTSEAQNQVRLFQRLIDLMKIPQDLGEYDFFVGGHRFAVEGRFSIQ